jgi:hypothetical protein
MGGSSNFMVQHIVLTQVKLQRMMNDEKCYPDIRSYICYF